MGLSDMSTSVLKYYRVSGDHSDWQSAWAAVEGEPLAVGWSDKGVVRLVSGHTEGANWLFMFGINDQVLAGSPYTYTP